MVGVIKGFSDPADELYEAVERELARLRRPPGRESQTLAYDLEALRCLAGSSVQEIDRLLGELQTVRDLLRAERERVQRELSQSSLQSTKIIAENLTLWESALASASPSYPSDCAPLR